MARNPLIVVGQARSGSTLLCALINGSGKAAIVNDAYFVQAADNFAAKDWRDSAKRGMVIERWLATLAIRSSDNPGATVDRSIVMSKPDFDAFAAEARALGERHETWPPLLQAFLATLARRLGAEAYGWNSPQDFAQAGRLLDTYPDSVAVFLMRDPFAVILSYKNLPAYWGRERDRYNPVFQSLVWRQAVRAYRALEKSHPGRVLLVRYEDMVARPQREVGRIFALAGIAQAAEAKIGQSSNTSHGRAGAKVLSRAERMICDRLTRERGELGYGPCTVEASGHLGLGELARTFARSGLFYARTAFGSRDMRRRLMRMARLVGGKAGV